MDVLRDPEVLKTPPSCLERLAIPACTRVRPHETRAFRSSWCCGHSYLHILHGVNIEVARIHHPPGAAQCTFLPGHLPTQPQYELSRVLFLPPCRTVRGILGMFPSITLIFRRTRRSDVWNWGYMFVHDRFVLRYRVLLLQTIRPSVITFGHAYGRSSSAFW